MTQFGLKFVKESEFKKEIFDLFARAQEDREEADYGLLSEIEEEEAKKIIEGADKFLKECKKKGW
jgi:uncharacterized protein (UPF0332 family)